MGEIFVTSIMEIKFEIRRVTFCKVFYHREIMGLTSDFLETGRHRLADAPDMRYNAYNRHRETEVSVSNDLESSSGL